ncbi:MAG: glycerol-3-phosphate dehydrogenase/oxidase [Calditrichaceae bacterium]|nr:glycerol-3-phosphate dehydrogenase/oxidase [Calditrichaceae bacterium]MBN2707546.1 glycerol-3-phosphate dehydrogenase/oxidase [Calditrichaceae bacterium]RQV95633.1 MAG: glycerol-3-phosphate dehydrogenase/oxidase [Calditrichota bacterium]
MRRNDMITRIEEKTVWDVLIIGGGATGTGIAVDAASRGYKTLLLEKGDFAQGTSSRSTKLVHGGVRYLQQGNITLVLEALRERGIMRRNAPHLVFDIPFVIPNYDWWEGPFYGIGLKLYDMLAGKAGFGKSEIISKDETIRRIPTVEENGLNGGVIYYDGQFDDSRLVINLAKTAFSQGAVLINYMPVTGLIKRNELIKGVLALDTETGKEYKLDAKVVINASGPFTDSIRKMDNKRCTGMISPSRGVHMVLDKEFLPANSAIMVPHTDDGRVLFAIPWYDKVVVGTTETPLNEPEAEPVPDRSEIEFLLEHTARYLAKDPSAKDILSVFAGVRPLVSDPKAENTAVISREHVVNISKSGLVTIAGGKWTTYRKMAEDTLDQAIMVGDLEFTPCVTENLQIHGYHNHPEQYNNLACYGSDATNIQNLIRTNVDYNHPIHPDLNEITGEIIWAVNEEMARTVEDFLARRRRSLVLNARASMEAAPKVADIMMKELGRDKTWAKEQVLNFNRLAEKYIYK